MNCGSDWTYQSEDLRAYSGSGCHIRQKNVGLVERMKAEMDTRSHQTVVVADKEKPQLDIDAVAGVEYNLIVAVVIVPDLDRSSYQVQQGIDHVEYAQNRGLGTLHADPVQNMAQGK